MHDTTTRKARPLAARRTRPLAAIGAALLALAACAGPSDTDPGSAISAERCQQNRDAGTVTYLSGYQFQASASILEFVAADALGYFDDLCLDVELQAGTGDTAQNTRLLASGQASISAVSQQDVIQARANGIDITGVSSYSNASLEILMTNPDITDLTQLNGSVVAHKGYMPAGVQAMMMRAGVDMDSLTIVQEGYDPSVLPRRQNDLAALTGFISNEPNQLAASGDPVTVWEPLEFGVPGSIGALAVNPAFAAEHPTAVEDVLRAALRAYTYCAEDEENARECIGYAGDLSGATYDEELNLTIWQTEAAVIEADPIPGQPLGGIDSANIAGLVEMLGEMEIIPASVSPDAAADWFDDSYVAAIYDGDALVWPAP